MENNNQIKYIFEYFITKTFNNCRHVKHFIREFFNNFDQTTLQNLDEKFMTEEKDSCFMFEKINGNIDYSVEFDPQTKQMKFKKTTISFDKQDKEEEWLEYNLIALQEDITSSFPLIFGEEGPRITQRTNHLLPNIFYGRKNNIAKLQPVANQSATKAIGYFEATSNENYRTFTKNSAGNLDIVEKNIQKGIVENFVNNEKFNKKTCLYTNEKQICFDLVNDLFPQKKLYQKRFVTVDKEGIKPHIVEDFEVFVPKMSNTEIVKYVVNGSKSAMNYYPDIVPSKKMRTFIKEVSINPLEITKGFGKDAFVEFDKHRFDELLNNPEIADKIFDRKLRQLERKQAMEM